MLLTSGVLSAFPVLLAVLIPKVAAAEQLPPREEFAIVEADDATATFVGDETYQLSLRQVARGFYAQHEDRFDTLIVLPAFATTASDGALYEAISNDVVGLNLDMNGMNPETFDLSEGDEYGALALEGMVQFGNLADLPDDPDAPLLGRWSALDLLAQEVAHRYGAFVWFSAAGEPSDALLGTDHAHWSFFFDSGGSPLGGNAWTQDPDGAWRTGEPSDAFGPLDLYLMGLLPASDVGDLRVLKDPVVTTKSLDLSGRPYGRDSIPAPGVIVKGDWRSLTVDEIVAVETARSPSADDSSAIRRHAFVAVHLAGDGGIDDAQALRIRALRRGWERHYAEMTDGRGRILGVLDGRDSVPHFPRDLLRHGWQMEQGSWVHKNLYFVVTDRSSVAVAGQGVGRVRCEGSNSGWSEGVVVELPGTVPLTACDVDVLHGLRVDPVPGKSPPSLQAVSIGPAEQIATILPSGDNDPSCGCLQAEQPWLLWAWSRRRG